MASHFDITTIATLLTLDDRVGRASFTIANTADASIRGDAVISAEPGTPPDWFTIAEPSRPYGPGHTEQLAVDVNVPEDAEPGSYGFKLRVLLGGGVPEEEFDDSPVVSFEVAEKPVVEPPPPTPERSFPWWIVAAAVGVLVLVVVIGGVFVISQQQDEGRLAFHPGLGGAGEANCELPAVTETYMLSDEELDCQTDASSSLVLHDVPQGTTVTAYGDAACAFSTDWAVIEVVSANDVNTVASFEQDVISGAVTVDHRWPRGPLFEIVNPATTVVEVDNIASFSTGTAVSDAARLAIVAELEAQGSNVVVDEALPIDGSADQVEARLEAAVAQGADMIVLSGAEITPEIEEMIQQFQASHDVLFEWPDTTQPDGLNGKVSCVEVVTE